MPQLYDMHCHLDFADNCEDMANNCDGLIAAVNATVVPSSFVSTTEKLSKCPDFHVALGLHPWWIADGRIGEVDIARFENLTPKASIIGEIGLDFHGKRRATRTQQLEVFARILEAIESNGSNRLIFLHSVKCYSDIFGLLEHYDIARNNTCVFHWFQGSNDDFDRALANGFYFSVGMRMLATPRGKTYAREIPHDRLMLETDNPPHAGMSWSYDAWEQELRDTAKSIAQLRNTTEQQIIECTADTSQRLLHMHSSPPATA